MKYELAVKKCRNRRKPFKRISPDKLRETRILSGFSKKEAADMFHVTYRTWHNWESGRVQVPYAAFKLLRILTGYELPGEAWRGFWFAGDASMVSRGQKVHSARFKLSIVDFRNGQTMAC